MQTHEISKIGVIVQARMGSTRLPNKMNMPFFKGQTILDIIIKRLLTGFSNNEIIIATSKNEKDAIIAENAEKHNVLYYRGDEENVLNRFIEAAEKNNIDVVIRICADNPFIQIDYIKKLISEYEKNNADYISYISADGTPSIKTHFGFFAELVKLSALRKVQKNTNDSFYLEHVTNYIYSHPDEFEIKYCKMPDYFKNNNYLRLTIDTIEDFEVTKDIYEQLTASKKEISVENIIEFVKANEYLMKSMSDQILKNTK